MGILDLSGGFKSLRYAKEAGSMCKLMYKLTPVLFYERYESFVVQIECSSCWKGICLNLGILML